jgi:hypothetical protein
VRAGLNYIRGKDCCEMCDTDRNDQYIHTFGCKPILQKWTWRDTWRAFAPNNPDLPLFTVRKTACCSFKPSLHVFLSSNTDQKVPDYTIKGKWLAKKCSVYLGNTQQLVAEVRRHSLSPASRSCGCHTQLELKQSLASLMGQGKRMSRYMCLRSYGALSQCW